MKVLLLLWRRAPGQVLLVALLGVISGLVNSTLFVLMNDAISSGFDVRLAIVFSALAVVVVGANAVPEMLMSRLVSWAIMEMRIELARAVVRAPLRSFEKLGKGTVIAAFNTDLQTLLAFASSLPGLVNTATLLAGCFGYLLWLSPPAFLVVVPVMAAGSLIQAFGSRFVRPYLQASRNAQDELGREQQQIVDGFKELKLHAGRRERYIRNVFGLAADRVRAASVRADVASSILSNIGHAHTWATMAVAILVLPRIANGETTRAALFVILYASGILQYVASFSNRFVRADVAMNKLNELELSILTEEPPTDAPPPMQPTAEAKFEIALRDVKFAYDSGSDVQRPFTVGPLSIALRSSELVFVVGGNGSGKTTLAKLLTGLYAPSSGKVSCNGTPVTDANRDSYRELFSAVFSDSHVFELLLAHESVSDEHARGLLEALQLTNKVDVRDGRFSTVQVSTGQRKRLALVIALLEDRPFYLFDEWTADQDPEFREVFYREIVPGLIGRGKGVIAITHDDRYFHLSDRVVELHDGIIASDGIHRRPPIAHGAVRPPVTKTAESADAPKA